MATNTQADIKTMTFERAIEELETIVKRLEDGKVPLEESVAIYERGETLKRRCEELLRLAAARGAKIPPDGPGAPLGTQPPDVRREPLRASEILHIGSRQPQDRHAALRHFPACGHIGMTLELV